jgi:hypothetical protein
MKRARFRYKNIAFLVCILVALLLLHETTVPERVTTWVGGFGYAGVLVTGAFFVSLFTVVPASVVLLSLVQELNPILIALVAGLGGTLGDFILFRFFKDGLFEELRLLFRHERFSRFGAIFKTRLFLWCTPFVGAFIIASPFPDEAGIALLGLSRLTKWQFLLISFVLNTAGIYALIQVVEVLQ